MSDQRKCPCGGPLCERCGGCKQSACRCEPTDAEVANKIINELTVANAKLQAERDDLLVYKALHEKALACVDSVFQEWSGHTPLLPDFLYAGDDKFEGVVKLAREYILVRDQLAEANKTVAACHETIEQDTAARRACIERAFEPSKDGRYLSVPEMQMDFIRKERDRLQAELAEAKDELENDPGDCADVRLGFENERLAAELAEAKAECERLREENTHLRAALAVSKDPCVYCQLPKEEMAKCKSGFPGCARMDDLTGCPEFGSMLNEQHLREELAALHRSHAEAVEAAVREIEAMRNGYMERLDGKPYESGAASGVMFGLDEAVRIFKRHLGPAAAGEKGE